jgi:anti-anti-sigma regulatory factor
MHSELDTKTVKANVSKSLLSKYIQKFCNVVIIDFSSVQFVDEAACKCLKEVVKEYKLDGVKVMFSNCDGKAKTKNLNRSKPPFLRFLIE